MGAIEKMAAAAKIVHDDVALSAEPVHANTDDITLQIMEAVKRQMMGYVGTTPTDVEALSNTIRGIFRNNGATVTKVEIMQETPDEKTVREVMEEEPELVVCVDVRMDSPLARILLKV